MRRSVFLIIFALALNALGVMGGDAKTPSTQPNVKDVAIVPGTAMGECEATGSCVENDPKAQMKSQAFLDWLKINGAFIHDAIEWPHYFPTSNPLKTLRGVRISKDIKGDEPLVVIPRKLALVTSDHVKQRFSRISDGFHELLEKNANPYSTLRQKDVFLALTLLEEFNKKNASFFAPYIAVLPELDDIPRLETWEAEDFKAFEDKNVLKAVKVNAARLRKVFEDLVVSNLVPAGTWSIFEWAYLCVRTRAVPYGAQGEKRRNELALVPFVDMFNMADKLGHNVASMTAGTSDNVEVFSMNDISEGAEATMYHGPYSSIYLLTNYGFVSENNPDDGFALALKGFPHGDPLVNLKQAVWNATTLSGTEDIVVIHPEEPPKRVLGFFRLLFATAAENVTNALLEQPCSPEEEEIALTACSRLIIQQLEVQKTLLEDDEAELARKDVIWTTQKTLALKYKVARKRILWRNRCYCDRLKAKNADLIQRYSAWDGYLKSYGQASREVEDECFL